MLLAGLLTVLSTLAAWELAPAAGSPLPGLAKVNAISLADVNGDRRPDIIAINGQPGELLVLLNQGNGGFAPAAEGHGAARRSIGASASGLAIADVNSDKTADIIVSFHDRDEIAVLRGKGNGEFEEPSMQSIVNRTQGSPHVHNLAVGDINGDGHSDVLVAQADDNRIVWALGDGTGRFTPGTESFAAGQHPYTITAADFNNDGHVDFASPNAESGDLTVGLGAPRDGAGRFVAPPAAAPRPRLPRQTLAVAAGDINGDRFIDLVGSSDANQRELTLLLGDGRGGFTAHEHALTAEARCYNQVVADLNGDGSNDIAAPSIDRSAVYVWLAEDSEALRFRRVEFATPGTDSQALSIADVNGDGALDAVTAGWERPTIAVLLGRK